MTQYVGSSAQIIKYLPSTNGKHFVYAGNIPTDKPALLVLGGALTVSEAKALGYMERLDSIIQARSEINMYAAVYKFESLDPMLVKADIFRRAGRRVALDTDQVAAQRKEQQLANINENEPTPGYIEDVYDELIEPRIVYGDAGATMQNMRNLIIYSHCHGAVVTNELARMAALNMQNAGFDDATIKRCLAAVVAIQHNPTAPLENAMFTTVNFMSASDDTLNFYDKFSQIALRQDNLAPAFMGKDYANVFIAGKLNTTNGAEHGFSYGYKNNSEQLTQNGKIIFTAEQNAINNAINAAIAGAEVPCPEQLVSGNDIDVQRMRATGKQLFGKVNRAKQSPRHVHQK